MSSPARGSAATEISLALVTLAAIAGMHRLFEDASFLPPLLLQVLVAHVVVALLRRHDMPLVPAAIVTAAAAVLALTWTHYAGSTTALLPTSATADLVVSDLRSAWQVFQDVRAPAPVETGFLVAAGTAIWVVVYVADWAALRARATFEALLPSATLFLFAAALGAPGGRVVSAVLYATAGLVFVLVQRTFSREESWSWTASQRLRTRWSLLGPGAVLIGVAVAAAGLAGPNLPGAQADPVVAWRDLGDEDDTRVVVSPLVNIQSQLVEQSNVELFRVRSSEPTYHRLTALDEFDGNMWRSSFDTETAEGELPRSFDSAARTQTVRQQIEITLLGNEWVPAAFEPVAIDPRGFDIVWDERSSSLIVDEDVATSDGFEYTVESQVPHWTEDELGDASGHIPDDVADRYLQLPPSVDPTGQIRALAEQVTASATNRYEQALALQRFFRSEFVYDQTVQHGQGKDAMLEFLTVTQTGFCQQFSGSFAAMARMLGIPTRVAVGFTPGIPDEEDSNLYRVLGTHAHAWNEVYFDELGWVIFDPTPGRAPNGAQDYLGLDPQQAQVGGDGSTSEPLPGRTDAAGGPDTPSPSPQSTPEPRLPDSELGATGDDSETSALTTSDDGSSLSGLVVGALRIVGLGVVAYLVLVPAALAGLRRVRRGRARRPDDRVRVAWHHATRQAAAAGIGLPPWLTIAETAERLASTLPNAADAVRILAHSLEQVAYAEVTPPAVEAERALWASSRIVGESRRSQGIIRRVRGYLDVRELWRDRMPRPRQLPSVPDDDLADERDLVATGA